MHGTPGWMCGGRAARARQPVILRFDSSFSVGGSACLCRFSFLPSGLDWPGSAHSVAVGRRSYRRMITACDQKIKETNTCLYKHKSGCRNELRGRVLATIHSRFIHASFVIHRRTGAESGWTRLPRSGRIRRVSIPAHFPTRNMRLVSGLLHIGHNSCRAHPALSRSGSFDRKALTDRGLRPASRLFYRRPAAFPYALRMPNRPRKMLRTRNVGDLKACF
jgi:hypothetical protein